MMTKLYSPFLSREGELLRKIYSQTQDEAFDDSEKIIFIKCLCELWLTQIKHEYENAAEILK